MALAIKSDSCTTTSISAYASGYINTVATFNWYLNNVYQTSTSIDSYTFDGLEAGTRYRLKVAFFDKNGGKMGVREADFWTGDAPTIAIPSQGIASTKTSISCAPRVSSNGAGKFYVVFSLLLSGREVDSRKSSPFSMYENDTYDLYWNFTGLSEGIEYKVQVAVYEYSTDAKYDSDYQYYSTKSFRKPTIAIKQLSSTMHTVGCSTTVSSLDAGTFYVNFIADYVGLSTPIKHKSNPFSMDANSTYDLYYPFENLPEGRNITVTVEVYRSDETYCDKDSGVIPTKQFQGPLVEITNYESTLHTVTAYAKLTVRDKGTFVAVFKATYAGTFQEHPSYPFSSSTTLEHTFSGIPDNVAVIYSVTTYSSDKSKEYETAKINTRTDKYQPSSITIDNLTATESTVKVDFSVSIPYPEEGPYYAELVAEYNGLSKTYDTYDIKESTSLTYTFEGLPSRSVITVTVFVFKKGVTSAEDYHRRTITTDGPPRPANWSWTSTVSSGTSMPYTRSGNTVTCKPLTAKEWNGFVDRVSEFNDYLGRQHVDLFIYYVEPGESFTINKPEKIRMGIEAMNPPIAPPKYTDSITAAYFNGLKNALNSIE